MRSTKLSFDFTEMRILATIVADLADDLASRDIFLDSDGRSELTRRVLDVASSGISDPDEIRLLVLERYAN